MRGTSSAERAVPRVVLARDLARDDLASALDQRRLVRVRRGAYIAPVGHLPRWQQRELVALARCVALARQVRRPVIFSHATAALIHGCRLWQVDEESHVIQSTRPSSATASIRRHTMALQSSELTNVHGLTVTSLRRTLVDCARTMHPRDALVIADHAARLIVEPDRRRQPASLHRLQVLRAELLERLNAQGGRGVRRARAVIAAMNPLSESAGETALRWIAVSRGLPAPTLQQEVITGRGRYFTDLAWRMPPAVTGTRAAHGHYLHAEFDGHSKYAQGAHVLVREKLREDAIRRSGDLVLRFTWDDLHRPDAVYHSLCAALGAPATMRTVPDLLTAADLL